MKGYGNIEALNEPELILCEAPFDALTFWVNGFKNVTFIYGTEGFTDELFDAILAKKSAVSALPTTPTNPGTGRRSGTPSAWRRTAWKSFG